MTKQPLRSLFLFAGEHSGDLHGSRLMRALKKSYPEIEMSGVGGPKMRAEGLDAMMHMEAFEVMGFTDVIPQLPKLWRQFVQIRNYILKKAPQAVVLIDYPGFNLRLAKALRRHGYKGKIIHYICPSVWAWGKKRIPLMAANLDLLLTIYPFEADCFAGTGLKVEYVGNPLQETLAEHAYDSAWRQNLGIALPSEYIALFPGSRAGEIKRNLPKQLEAAQRIKIQNPQAAFAVSCMKPESEKLIREAVENTSLMVNRDLFLVPHAHSYDMMRDCQCAIAKSGTVTLELALHQKPAVVMYELTALNRFIAKYIIRLNMPHYCIVNILGQKRVFPELIEKGNSVEDIFQEAQSLYWDGEARRLCLKGCTEVLERLQRKQASVCAAEQIGALFS